MEIEIIPTYLLQFIPEQPKVTYLGASLSTDKGRPIGRPPKHLKDPYFRFRRLPEWNGQARLYGTGRHASEHLPAIARF